jgi:hypothetical protein
MTGKNMNNISINTLPMETLNNIFSFMPNAGQLVNLSFVSKKFYDCSQNINLWQGFIDRPGIHIHCTTGQGAKQGLLNIIRRLFAHNTSIKHNLPVHHYVKAVYPEQLKLETHSKYLPIEFNGKYYSVFLNSRVYEHPVILVSTSDNSTMLKEIPLSQLSFTSIVADPVQLNNDFLVFQSNLEPNNFELCMLNLSKSHPDPHVLILESSTSPFCFKLTRGNIVIKKTANNEYPFNEFFCHNYAIPPLIEFLDQLNEFKRDQIRVLREFIPESVRVPLKFQCPITCQIMANPVRDKCPGEDGGHVFEQEAILHYFSKEHAPSTALKVHQTVDSPCPLTNLPMSEVTRRCTRITYVHEMQTYTDVNGNEHPLPAQKRVCEFKVNAKPGLIPDQKLQAEILAWLKKEVFENQFSQLPAAEQTAIYEHLFKIQNPKKHYFGIGKHAFLGRNKQSSTLDEKIGALQNRLHETRPKGTVPGPFKKELRAFIYVPESFQTEIFGHLFDIQKPSKPYWGIGEDAFFCRNGQASTIDERIAAVRRTLQAAQLDALEWLL